MCVKQIRQVTNFKRMKKKLTLIFALLLIALCGAFASDMKKKVIAIAPFKATGNEDTHRFAANFTETVVDALVSSNRFKVVERSDFNLIFSEENLQKNESFIDGLVVEQGKKLGAEYIITGSLSNIEANESWYKERNGREKFEGYVGRIGFSLKILDVKTGEIVASKIMGNTKDKSWYSLLYGEKFASEEKAKSRGIEKVREPLLSFIDIHFPLVLKVFEITEEKKDRVKEITIAGGKDLGVKEGQKFRLMELSDVEVDGRSLQKKTPLGWATVKSVDGENFSTCKVQRNGSDILKQKMDSQAAIYAVSGQQ